MLLYILLNEIKTLKTCHYQKVNNWLVLLHNLDPSIVCNKPFTLGHFVGPLFTFAKLYFL